MLPIEVTRQITQSLQTFQRTTLPVTETVFRRDANRKLIDNFLYENANLSNFSSRFKKRVAHFNLDSTS